MCSMHVYAKFESIYLRFQDKVVVLFLYMRILNLCILVFNRVGVMCFMDVYTNLKSMHRGYFRSETSLSWICMLAIAAEYGQIGCLIKRFKVAYYLISFHVFL